MKIKFIATGNAPDKYNFNNEAITAYYGGVTNTFDLSSLNGGDKFKGLETLLNLTGSQIIRNAERVDGTLYVTLCQRATSGHWQESDWINASDYNANTTYIKEVLSNG